jgi:hypothetical protein
MTNVQKSIRNNIFTNFLVRDLGFTHNQAKHELDFVTINGVDRLESSYLTTSRIGATKTLTRSIRKQVYASFQNATNHAIFCEVVV